MLAKLRHIRQYLFKGHLEVNPMCHDMVCELHKKLCCQYNL